MVARAHAGTWWGHGGTCAREDHPWPRRPAGPAELSLTAMYEQEEGIINRIELTRIALNMFTYIAGALPGKEPGQLNTNHEHATRKYFNYKGLSVHLVVWVTDGDEILFVLIILPSTQSNALCTCPRLVDVGQEPATCTGLFSIAQIYASWIIQDYKGSFT